MKERKYVLGALVACLVIVASTVAGLAAAKPGKKAGGVQGRLDLSGAAQRRRLVAGARRRAAWRVQKALG